MRRLSFLVLMVISLGSWAGDFWYIGPIDEPLAVGETAEAACRKHVSNRSGNFSRLDNELDRYALCRWWSSGGSSMRNDVRLSSCPNGEQFNPETGQCQESCEDTIGKTLLVRGPNSSVFSSNGINYITSSASSVEGTCTSNCSYNPLSDFGASCYLVPGSTSTGYCNYIVMGTGDSCSTFNMTPGDTSGDPLNPSPDPGDGDGGDPDQPDPCHGVPGYTWNGSTCVSDGGGDGDGGNGGDGGDGDGDGGNGGGPGDGGGPGNGGGGDGDGDGDGSGSGPGNGGGTGPGSGDGDGEGEEDEGGVTPSAACDTPPQVTGDPVQAAVVLQIWHDMCHGEELTASRFETEIAGAGLDNADDLDDYLADNADNSGDIEGQIRGVVDGVFSSGPGGGTCPVQDVSISTRWGTIGLPWSMSCPIFSVISQVMFWFAYLAAGWILFNSLARSD